MAAKNPYKDIVSMLKQADKAKTDGEKLAADLNRYFQLSRPKYVPSATLKPSGIYGCIRMQYFILIQEEVDAGKLDDPVLINMGNAGTDRHIRIQNALIDMPNYNMPVQWLPLKDVMQEVQNKGIRTWIKREDGPETLCHNEDYNSNFRCDGVFLYGSHRYILEIKTVEQSKFRNITSPLYDHRLQATAYSIFLDIPDVMFYYEDRNLFGNKPYIYTPSEKEKQDLKDRMRLILAFADRKIMPAAEKDKCTYCSYKNVCKKVSFDAEADARLRQEMMYSGNESQESGSEVRDVSEELDSE